MSAKAPAATGTLGATPLANLLLYSLERSLNGTFVFETQGGTKSALTVRDGCVINSRVDGDKHLLGEVCVSLGLLQPEAVERALGEIPGELLGEALVKRGLDPADLERALAKQLSLHVDAIAALPPETVWGYYAGRDFLERWGAPRLGVDPLELVWRSVSHVPPSRVRDVIARLEGLPTLRLHLRSRVGRFGFSPQQSALLDVLRTKPQSYGELARLGLLVRGDLDRVLYTLALSRHLDMGQDTLPLGVEPAAPRTPPPRPAAPTAVPATESAANTEDDARRRHISELHDRLDRLDYYELLGVPREVDATGVQAAFFQLARQWHPDKLPAALGDQSERVTRIFARLTEAHRVLSNPARRAEYDRLLQQSDGSADDEQAKVQQVLRAVTAFQKAEVMARREDWPQVVKYCEQAQADDPEQAEYSALLAFARMKMGFASNAEAEAAVQALNAAVDRDRNNLRIRLHRASVLTQLGRVAEAMRDYRAVVDADPTNVEAQRELRLFKMRRNDAVEEKPAPGRLLGKLFKKG